MVKKFLFIEGTANNSNEDLRKGFESLFEQRLKGNMPRIVMGDNKTETIDKFKNKRFEQSGSKDTKRFLLIDLDNTIDTKNDDIDKHELAPYPNKCFYMIQEMEAWFISQSESVLDKYYKASISERFPKKQAIEFKHPDEEIKRCLQPFGKVYKKVRDGVGMLKLLNLEKLMTDFPDVKNLVEELQKA